MRKLPNLMGMGAVLLLAGIADAQTLIVVVPPAPAPPREGTGSGGLETAPPVASTRKPIYQWLKPEAGYDATRRVTDRVESEPLTSNDMGNIFDLRNSETPWSTTTDVRLLANANGAAPLTDKWVPFVSLAREIDALEHSQRFGYGGGVAYYFTPEWSLAFEGLYFDRPLDANDSLEHESRLIAEFRLTF